MTSSATAALRGVEQAYKRSAQAGKRRVAAWISHPAFEPLLLEARPELRQIVKPLSRHLRDQGSIALFALREFEPRIAIIDGAREVPDVSPPDPLSNAPLTDAQRYVFGDFRSWELTDAERALGPSVSGAFVGRLRRLAQDLADAGVPLDPNPIYAGTVLVLAQLVLLKVDRLHDYLAHPGQFVSLLWTIPPGGTNGEMLYLPHRFGTATLERDLLALRDRHQRLAGAARVPPSPLSTGRPRGETRERLALRAALPTVVARFGGDVTAGELLATWDYDRETRGGALRALMSGRGVTKRPGKRTLQAELSRLRNPR